MSGSNIRLEYFRTDVKVSFGVLCSYAVFYVLFFLPTLMDGKLLAPGDGLMFYYPVIERPFALWSNLILSGYPTFADSQFLTWYPLKLMGLHYNGVVVFAYILASFFTYGLCRRITGSHSAGAFGGLVFGMSGFMAAHMGHLTIINAAAWIPLLLWSLDHVTTRPTIGWWLIGAGAVACSFLAGHPQIFVYGMLLAGGFALYRICRRIRESRSLALRVGVACIGMVTMGCALAAIQIFPLIEVSSSSVREALNVEQGWTFQDFTSFYLPLRQLPMALLFPNLLGTFPPAGSTPLNLVPYFGDWNLTEISCYFGMPTLLLAMIAPGTQSMRSQALFWEVAAVFSAFFALGRDGPLAHLAFHLPVIGSFRAPARSAMVLDLSLAVLASIGLKSLIDKKLHRNALAGACVSLAVILLGATAYVLITYPTTRKLFDQKVDGGTYHLPPAIYNPAIYCPILLAVAGLLSVLLIAKNHVRHGYVLLLMTATIDLGLFGYYGSGRASEADQGRMQMDSTWQAVKDDLVAHHGRLLPLENDGSDISPGSQIINMVRGIPSAGGYGPLMQENYARATGMNSAGYLQQPRADSPLFKLLDVRWILSNRNPQRPLILQLGAECGSATLERSHRVQLPVAVRATRLHIVSYMGCSTGIAQNDEVLQIHLRGASGASDTIPLLAGRDTSEWAIERPDVAGAVRHQSATVASSFRVGGFWGHTYKTDLAVGSKSPMEVQEIEFDWRQKVGTISASEITLIDDTTGSRYAVPSIVGMPPGEDWEQQITTPRGHVLQHYRKGLGPAWLVNETRHMERAEIAKAIAAGRLPDQSDFDPGSTALIEGQAPSRNAVPMIAADDHVEVISMKPEHWSLDVTSTRAAFLVISQLYYPGWGVNVNGKRENLYRTNYAFQGVDVPAGHSRVELSFRSRSLLYGGGITLLAILASFGLAGRDLWVRRRSVYAYLMPLRRGYPRHGRDPATPVTPNRLPS